MRIVTFLLVILFIALVTGFSILNADNVLLNYYFGTLHWPLSLILVIVFLLGLLIGFIINLSKLLRSRLQTAKVKRELQQLRKSPVKNHA